MTVNDLFQPLKEKLMDQTSEHLFLGGAHCVKRVRFRSYSAPYFLACGLNTEKYSIKCRMRQNTNQNNFEYGHFSCNGTDKLDLFHKCFSFGNSCWTLASVVYYLLFDSYLCYMTNTSEHILTELSIFIY